jgi:hypothetical protein
MSYEETCVGIAEEIRPGNTGTAPSVDSGFHDRAGILVCEMRTTGYGHRAQRNLFYVFHSTAEDGLSGVREDTLSRHHGVLCSVRARDPRASREEGTAVMRSVMVTAWCPLCGRTRQESVTSQREIERMTCSDAPSHRGFDLIVSADCKKFVEALPR